MATTDLGKIGITPKGTWGGGKTYERLDAVAHLGASYLALRDTDTEPTKDSVDWMLLAEGISTEGVEIVIDNKLDGVMQDPDVWIFEGATEKRGGKKGFVPAPEYGMSDGYLCSNGVWRKLNEIVGAETYICDMGNIVKGASLGITFEVEGGRTFQSKPDISLSIMDEYEKPLVIPSIMMLISVYYNSSNFPASLQSIYVTCVNMDKNTNWGRAFCYITASEPIINKIVCKEMTFPRP